MEYLSDDVNVESVDESNLALPLDDHYVSSVETATEYYQTGGYWLTGTQMMDLLFQNDTVADVAFDHLEELIWCITKAGQLSAFYSTNLERYITCTFPLLVNANSLEDGSPFTELKQVLPSSNPMEHSVFVLANNALHAFSKSGKPLASAMDKRMSDLECVTVTGQTGGAMINGSLNMWNNMDNYTKFFLGGLQPLILELDACDRWGEVINTIDVGVGGSVVLKPFTGGFCAGTTNGKVLLIDPRTRAGVVREIDAHTGEISDITVDGHGHTLVTCGWSRLGESGLRVDRLLRVYDLRSGRARLPLSASLDPCFARFIPGCSDRLLTASQTGALQTIRWGKSTFSLDDLGQLWLNYDRLSALDISQNGNCAVFVTEGGQLQLYLRDMNMCQFNASSIPTLFAPSCAESLLAANNLSGSVPSDYPVLATDDPDNVLYGTNLSLFGKCAADSARLQLMAVSLHQSISPDEATSYVDFVEAKRRAAALDAINVCYKPVSFDDSRFSLATLPFAYNPPSVLTLSDKKENSYSSVKSKEMVSSDWPSDLYPLRPRRMNPVDPDLLNNANYKNAVRKPLHWSNVWHPYSSLDIALNKIKVDQLDLKLGRFVDVNDDKGVESKTS